MACRLGMVVAVALLAQSARADFFAYDLETTFGIRATAFNGNRQFAGSFDFPGEGVRAFRFDIGSGPINLGTLGGAFSMATALNEVGWVAGDSRVNPANSVVHSFLWRPGIGLTDLGTLGGTASSAAAVNQVGWVVGNSQTPGNAFKQAFLWRPETGTMVSLGSLNNTNSAATGVNLGGAVVGVSDSPAGVGRPFLWTPTGGLTDLGGLGGPNAAGRANGINDANSIVGASDRGDGTTGAFLWQPGMGFLDLGTLGGVNASATSITQSGIVVGTAENAGLEPRAFVWDATNGIRDLNDLILGGGGIGLTLTSAIAVSDRGDILAVRQGQDGASYFLLTEQPLDTNSVPAPAAFALVLAALPILGYRRFRQTRETS